MPASITHELIAREALGELPPRIRDAATDAPDYFYLGAQGPDLFFFYRPLSHKSGNFGRFLHRNRVYDWFAAMLDVLPGFAGDDFKKCLAYALGFCSHLAADVVFHPFVYNYLGATDSPRSLHQKIENDWDVYFLRELQGQSVFRHSYPFDLKEIADGGVLFRFVSETAGRIGREINGRAFRRMLALFRRYLTHFHTRVKLLAPLGLGRFYPDAVPDPAHLGGEKFASYAKGNASADELFLRAVQESVERITSFMEAFNADMVLPESLFSRHMLTGERL